MNKNTQQPTQLTPEKFQAIAGAFARLQSLGERSIDTGPSDNTVAEKEQLLTYLATEMLAHANEFLACYDLVHREYLPFLTGLQRIAIRAGYPPKPSVAPVNPANPVNPALN